MPCVATLGAGCSTPRHDHLLRWSEPPDDIKGQQQRDRQTLLTYNQNDTYIDVSAPTGKE
jgi:hypothetical protein